MTTRAGQTVATAAGGQKKSRGRLRNRRSTRAQSPRVCSGVMPRERRATFSASQKLTTRLTRPISSTPAKLTTTVDTGTANSSAFKP